MTGSASRTGIGRSCVHRSPARPATTGRRRDRGPGSRGRACTDPAPRGRSRRGGSPARRARDAVQPRAPGMPGTLKNRRFSTGPAARITSGRNSCARLRSAPSRGLVQRHLRDPGRAGSADRLGRERDEPFAAQSPLVGRRQAPLVHERLDARDGSAFAGHRSGRRPRPESGLLVPAHEVAAEVVCLRPCGRGAFAASGAVGRSSPSSPQATIPITSVASTTAPSLAPTPRRIPETFRGSLMSGASAGTPACTMGAGGPMS